MHTYLQSHAHKSEFCSINSIKCVFNTQFEISNVLRLTIVSFFSEYFLYAPLLSMFWKQHCTMHIVVLLEFGLCFENFHEQLSLFFQCDIIRYNANALLNHRYFEIHGETRSIVVYRKHYGRKWGHLKITVHPIIITTK